MTGVVSLKQRRYKADAVVQITQNHSVCDRCYVITALMLFGLLLEPKLRWIHQYLISYVWQLVFVYISIKGCVINSDENGFFDGSCQIWMFSAHNVEVINICIMTSGVMMVMDGKEWEPTRWQCIKFWVYSNSNDIIYRQVGEEFIRSPPHQGPSLHAGPWAQLCHSS